MKNISLWLLFFYSFSIETNAQWQQSNGPYGGIIECMAENSSGLFVSESSSGVYFSSDQGAHWEQRNTGISTTTVFSLIAGGEDIYAGAYDGLYKTTDNGLSWVRFNTGLPTQVSFVHLLWDGINLIAGTYFGLFFTGDSGTTWHSLPIDTFSLQINSLALIAGNLYVGTDHGLYVSSNHGSNWSPSSPGITNVGSVTGQGQSLIVETPVNINHSSDGGLNWTVISTGLACPHGNTFVLIAGDIYAGSMSNFYVSHDSGQTFIQLYSGNFQINDILFSGNFIYLCTYGGVLKSTDGGITFNLQNYGIGGQLNCLYSDDNIVLASNFGGVYTSFDNGLNWTLTNSQLKVRAFKRYNSMIFAGVLWEGVYVSFDNGITWIPRNAGLVYDNVYSFAIINNEIYGATESQKIIKSTDDGLTWNTMNNGMNMGFVQLIEAIDSSLITITQTGIFTSTNHGITWNLSMNGITDTNFHSLVVIDSVLFLTGGSNIYKSTDKGLSWSLIAFPPAYSWVYRVYSDGRNLFLSTLYNGLFMSPDLGISWVPFNSGLPNTMISTFSSNSSRLFAGGYGLSGVWYYDGSPTSVYNVHQPEGGMVAFPNPFSKEVSISYFLQKNSKVTIQVINISGSVVETINADNLQTAGKHDFQWQSDIPGIYFVRIQTEDETVIKKLVCR